MRHPICFLIIAILFTCLLTGCYVVEKWQVRQQLDTTLEQLPDPDSTDLVDSVNYEFVSTEGEWFAQCVYARTILVYGSHAEKVAALDEYATRLIASGWYYRDYTFHDENWERSRSLERGDHESLWIDNVVPFWSPEEELDYETVQAEYPTVLSVSIDYSLPNRDDC